MSNRRHSLHPSVVPALFAASCFGVGLCAAAPKAAPKKAPPTAASAASSKPVAKTASGSSAPPGAVAGGNQDAKPVTVAIAAGKVGTWSGKQANVSTPINVIGSVGAEIYALGNKTVFHSANGGRDWLVLPVTFDGTSFWSFAANDVWIAGNQLAHSTDHGGTWTVTAPFPSGVGVQSLWGANPKELFAVGGGGGGGGTILYSKDSGKTFTRLSPGVKGGWLYQIVGSGDELVVVGKEDQGERSKAVLLVSKDHGKQWTRLTPPQAKSEFESATHVCIADAGRLYITTSYDVYSTIDRGKNWQNLLTTENMEILAFACRGRELYVGGRNRSFYHSKDSGAKWNSDELKPVFVGMAFSSVQAIHITAQGDVFSGGEGEYKDRSGSLFRLNR